jgi:hypothetical protein
VTARAQLRARLATLGARPTAAPSPDFVRALGERLAHTAPPAVVTVAGLTRRDVRDGLQRVGRAAARPAPVFVAALEDRLQHTDPAADVAVAAAPRHHAVLRASMAAAASVAAVLLATALLGGFGTGQHQGLQLGNAVNATVVLPNGHVVAGHSGLSLPDGSVVRTGPNGRVTIGSVTLGPGSQGVVNGGQLIPSPPNVAPITPAIPTPPVTVPAASPAPVTLPNLPAFPHGPSVVPTTLPHGLLPNLLPGLLP